MNRKNLTCFAGFFIVALVYLLLCSGYTSPLFGEMVNYDSAIFMLVGKGILEGKELYTEIFDHKGPVLFWLEALGMLGGRMGIFLLQLVFMTVNLYLINKIAGLWELEKKKRFLIIGLTLLILSYPLSNGNLSEEYGLPFTFLPLYLFLKDWRQKEVPSLFHSWIYGICFGVHAFIRINNGISVCAIVGCWLVWLIWQKKVKELGIHLLVGLAGIGTVALPILLFFYSRGTLYDMLYATFLFNLEYSSRMSFLTNLSSKSTLAHMVILFSPLLLAAWIFIWKGKREVKWALEFILLTNILMLFLGYGYNHYFTTSVPMVTLMLCVWFGDADKEEGAGTGRRLALNLGKWGMACVVAGYSILFLRILVLNADEAYLNERTIGEKAAVKEALGTIPAEERQSVLGVDVQAKYYLYGDVLPCYRYGILQSHWSKSNPEIMGTTLSYIKENPPLWLMTEPEYENDGLQPVLEVLYESRLENEFIALYRLKK